MSKKVGFVGLGEMGLPMALHLQKSGFQVYAFDINQSNHETLQQNGIICCDSIKEVTENSDQAVISMVRTADQTEDVIFGELGITSVDKQGMTIIVMSTIDPTSMRELEEKVEKRGFYLVDAPVSGKLPGAEAATLTIMTSGRKEIVENCKPYFQAMGKSIFYFGNQCGSGQAAKLTNNLVHAINVVGCLEGLKFGREYNLSTEDILKVLSVSSGSSWVVDNWENVKSSTRETSLGALYKDLTSVLKECSYTQVSLPLGALTTHRLFDAFDEENREYSSKVLNSYEHSIT